MKTYDIKEEFLAIQELLENEEFDEVTGELIDNSETVQELLAEVQENMEEKANGICYLITENKMYEDSLKAEAKRLTARAKMFARVQDNLKELLKFLLNGEKLKTERFTISYRKSTSVNITDDSLIPAEFINVKETFTVDKKAVADKLKDFEEVAGAELVVKNSITIK